jgi:hypothetical protein
VGERAAATIRKAFPGVHLAEHCGYFDVDPASAESVALRHDIAAFDPDIILVGMVSIGAAGLLIDQGLRMVAKKLLPWSLAMTK